MLTPLEILQNKLIQAQQNLAAATATNAAQNAGYVLVQDSFSNQIANLQTQITALTPQ